MSTRSDFPTELPNRRTTYCFLCRSESVQKIDVETKNGPLTQFTCGSCNRVSDRVRIWDPNMVQYFDNQNNLVHDGAGVLIENMDKRFLFFMRTKYPFLWTIPGGHLAPGEDPKSAAFREVHEEVGISLDTATLIFEGIIHGDMCMGGADIHKWHLYHARVDNVSVSLDEEGSKYEWIALENIPENTTFPVRFLLSQDSVIEALT